MEDQVEETRGLAGRAARLYGQVLDRLEAALERMPVSDVSAEELGQLVAILKGAELSWRGLERVKAGGADVAKTLADLMRELEVEEAGEGSAVGASAVVVTPVPDESDEGGGEEDEGDPGPDPVAGAGGPGRYRDEGTAQ